MAVVSTALTVFPGAPFAAPKVLCTLVILKAWGGFPLALVTKCLERCPCQVKLLPLDQKSEPSPGVVFWLFLSVLLFTLLGRFTPPSRAFHLPHIQTNYGPWPYQQSFKRHFYKIWKLGNICDLHGSIKHYKNVMKLRNLQRPPPLDFLNIPDLQLICISGEKKIGTPTKGFHFAWKQN